MNWVKTKCIKNSVSSNEWRTEISRSLIRVSELLFQTQQWQYRPQVSSKLEAHHVTLSTGEESAAGDDANFPEILCLDLATASNQRNDEVGWIEETIALFIPAAYVMEAWIVSIGLAYFIFKATISSQLKKLPILSLQLMKKALKQTFNYSKENDELYDCIPTI